MSEFDDTADEERFEALRACFWRLEDREKKVLLDVAGRLLVGQETYGALEHGKKLWCQEALEEAMDGMVYLGAALQDLADTEPTG